MTSSNFIMKIHIPVLRDPVHFHIITICKNQIFLDAFRQAFIPYSSTSANSTIKKNSQGLGSFFTLQITYSPSKYPNISGATILASDSMMYFGVLMSSFPQVIFSFGTAPE